MSKGVHGYFPAPLIRSVLGQPTGTSIRFANGAADAIQRWTAEQGYSCEVEKVALEGEGKISERLELLWKLLLNWLEDIRKADFVMIACHVSRLKNIVERILSTQAVERASRNALASVAKLSFVNKSTVLNEGLLI